MASNMKSKLFLSCAAFLSLFLGAVAMDNLNVMFEWRQLDFAYPSDSERIDAIQNSEFVPDNNIPVGLEVSGDRLFVTVPRWKSGVPSSLNYISLSNKTTTSPKLIPYPNWSAHRAENGSVPDIISPFRVRADACGKLWVIDSGLVNIIDNFTSLANPQLIIYDLKTDELLTRHVIPNDQLKDGSFFATIAVEDTSCDDTYAYIADIGSAGLIVYSLKSKTSWRIQHHYFYPDPLSGDFNVKGINFQWNDAVFGLALSPANDGYSTLYFHPLASTSEFSVNTRILRDKDLAEKSFNEFKVVGNRGPNAQSSVEFVDNSTGVLFYGLVNLNAVACWKTSNKEYNIQNQGRVFMSNETMVFPIDLKVDDKSNLWVLSNKLPVFMYSKLNNEEINFRILSAPVKDAIKNTACDKTISGELLNKIKEITKPITNLVKKNSTSGVAKEGVSKMSLFIVQSLVFAVMFLMY